jgi:hypothetical protein
MDTKQFELLLKILGKDKQAQSLPGGDGIKDETPPKSQGEKAHLGKTFYQNWVAKTEDGG